MSLRLEVIRVFILQADHLTVCFIEILDPHILVSIDICFKGGPHQCKQISVCQQTLQPIFRAHHMFPKHSSTIPATVFPTKIPKHKANSWVNTWTTIFALLKESHTKIFLYSMSKCWSIWEDIIHVDMIEKTKMRSYNLQGLRVLITVSQCLTHNDIHSSYKAIVSYKLHTLRFFLWTNCWNSTWDCKTLLLAWLVNGSKWFRWDWMHVAFTYIQNRQLEQAASGRNRMLILLPWNAWTRKHSKGCTTVKFLWKRCTNYTSFNNGKYLSSDV